MAKKRLVRAALLVAALCAMCGAALFSGCGRKDAPDYVSAYRAQTSSAEEAREQGEKLNLEIEREGITLLKNDGTLPLTGGSRITVLGKNSVNPVYGGGGSASGADGGSGATHNTDLYSALQSAGFVLNPVTMAFYADDTLSGNGRDGGSGTGQVATITGETPVSSYKKQITDSFTQYNDAAIIFITRAGGEGSDLMTWYSSAVAGRSDYSTDGSSASGEHYLETDDNEEALISLAKQYFKKIIVVLNTGTTFELGQLEQDEYINAIVWAGFPGGNGFAELGGVLSGLTNPSGRTPDLYSADFKSDPTFVNFGNNNPSIYLTAEGGNSGVNFVEYDEGIYLGYRYYETRGYEEGGSWYADNVVYPFGYGLSYTQFEWNVNFLTEQLSADGGIEVEVTVKNEGKYAGKDVVELYYSAPYIAGEVEKSHVVLGAFAKTELLQPGQSEKVTLSLDVRDMASYDYADANGNGFAGYELDAGVYTVYIGKNSHCWAESAERKTYALSSGIKFTEDEKTGAQVKNVFGYMSDYFNEDAESTFAGHSSLMSRADFEGTFPKPVTEEQRRISAEEQSGYTYSGVSPEYDEGKPWYTDEMPEQAGRTTGQYRASDLVGLDYDDELWNKFMDSLSLEDMRSLIVDGYFITTGLESVGLPMSVTPDGPTGFVQGSGHNWVGNTCFYCSPIVLASTWNTSLARRMGESIGEEGIWGGENGVQGGYNGWYAPGVNLHRSPFSGRNFEYYSEDPLLSSAMCTEVVAGAQSRGVFVMIKHFALNDQETNRANLATWADEQTIRELYLKAFKGPVKQGGATGIMSAFNRMGNMWSSACYELLTSVLRDEWGFHGLVITDWANYNRFMDGDMMIRAGADLWLGNGEDGRIPDDIVSLREEDITPTHAAAIRRAAKNIIYTVVNSNAMNRLGERYSAEICAEGETVKALGTVAPLANVRFDASSAVYTDYEYVLTGAPEGVDIDGATGMISGTVAASAAEGDYIMTVSLRDKNGFIGQSVKLSLSVKEGGAMQLEAGGVGCNAAGSDIFVVAAAVTAALLVAAVAIKHRNKINK